MAFWKKSEDPWDMDPADKRRSVPAEEESGPGLLDQLQESVDYGDADLSRILEPRYLRGVLLNGAESWSQYSWGGCSLCYDGDIAKRLCTPSELKRTRSGECRPNSREEWLDTQARALIQAANLIVRRVRMLAEEAAA